jgi:FixJ family two-component response regulator
MPDTVKKHRAQIMAKMEVNSLAELLLLCKDFMSPDVKDFMTRQNIL